MGARQPRRRHQIVIIPVVAGLLALPACDIYDMGAFRQGRVASSGNGRGVVIQDGGSIAADCVLNVIKTGGTAVGVAVSPPFGTIGVIVSWTLFGWQTGDMMGACLGSWHESVEPDLRWRQLTTYCAFRYNFYAYDDCVLQAWALWQEMQFVNGAIGAGLIWAWTVL